MRNVTGIILSLMILSGLVLTATPSRGQQVTPGNGNVVRWETMIGSTGTGLTVATFQPFSSPTDRLPWVAQGGKALVNLQTGQANFSVRGLVLANSTLLAAAGTIGLVQQVKGTLVCNGLTNVASVFADTPAVPLDRQGNAEFAGAMDIPNECFLTPDKLVFLIRVALAPEVPPVVGQWIAVGGVRTP